MDEGISWFNQGDFEKAREGFRKVLNADSENEISSLFIKILDGMQAGDLNKERLGSKAGYELEKGKELFAEERYQEAIIQFSLCLALDSTMNEASVFLNRAQQEFDQIQKRLALEASLSKEQLAYFSSESHEQQRRESVYYGTDWIRFGKCEKNHQRQAAPDFQGEFQWNSVLRQAGLKSTLPV